ncbi:MAG: carbohydrate kinase [Candidatus Methanomethylophilaceae archaeon]|nr:carbohydrate kinase [Candidatus Methanomethylophilaceae archaeon]
MKPFVSVYGHVTVDQIVSVRRFPKEGTTEDLLTKTTTLGGTGTNIALMSASLGCPTAICAFVGNDFPAQYEKMMEDSGLIMDEFVHVDRYETSTAVVVNGPDLVQKVLFYQGPQGFADDLGIMLDKNASDSEYVHFCTGQPSYYIHVMENLVGPKVALDPAQESHRIWNSGNLTPALGMSDMLFCNDIEADTLKGYLGIGSIYDADVGMVVCTHGSKGSTARIGDGRFEVPLVNADRVVDATGAGDSYRAGFYTALYRGYPKEEALVLASSVASFVVEKVGALTNIPTWEQVVARAEPYMNEIA